MAVFLLIVHCVWVLISLLGIVAIPLFDFLGWAFIHSAWFRIPHFVMVSIVFVETVFKWRCPLTLWEDEARAKTGDVRYPMGFTVYWVEKITGRSFPPWYYTASYVALFVIPLAFLFVFPPTF